MEAAHQHDGPDGDPDGRAAGGSFLPGPGRAHRTRLCLAASLVTLLFAGLVARLFHVQILEHGRYFAAADAITSASEGVPSYRGDIVSSDGVLLARDVRGYDLGIDPEAVSRDHLPEVIRLVCDACDLPAEHRRERAIRLLDVKKQNDAAGTAPRIRYVSLARFVDEATVAAIEEALVRLLPERERRGLVRTRCSRRSYPRGELLGSVVGATDSAGAGVEGVERMFDSYLAARDGRREFLVDASRQRNKIFQLESDYTAPLETYDVHLTIDTRTQAIAEEELREGVERERADSGLLVVMDANTGDVLAMADYPTYDPNRYSDYTEKERAARRRNGPVERLYEPGSIIKPFILSLALERGVVSLESPIRALMPAGVSWDGSKTARFGKRLVVDVKEHPAMTVEDVLVHSSNIGMSILGLKLGREGLIDVLDAYGLALHTGISLPAEAKGRRTPDARWKALTTSVSVSFGYEVLVSPIQLCRAFAALVNGGFLLEPRIVKRLSSGGRNHDFPERQVVGRPLSEATSRRMRSVLREVVERGTGQWLAVEGFEFGGKTGTAVMQRGGVYVTGEHVASFEAFAPFADPQVVVLCMVERPRGLSRYGGTVAGPIVIKVLRRLFGVEELSKIEKIEKMQAADG